MVQKIVKQIHAIKTNPKFEWEHINILKIAMNAKENIGVFGQHFFKLLNSERAINKSVLHLIQQCHKLRSIDKQITFMEVNKANTRPERSSTRSTDSYEPNNAP